MPPHGKRRDIRFAVDTVTGGGHSFFELKAVCLLRFINDFTVPFTCRYYSQWDIIPQPLHFDRLCLQKSKSNGGRPLDR